MSNLVLFIMGYLLVGKVSAQVNPHNATGSKDMYVVRATVYQVGILTNSTNDTKPHTGKQEAITFYHNKGHSIDLSSLPGSLSTNVTAEHLVGLAPAGSNLTVPWGALNEFQPAPPAVEINQDYMDRTKREADTAKIVNGAAVIPPQTGVQSIALPPLLAFNNNLSHIPVPIPNVSVVSYAKVNTLVSPHIP